MNTNNTLNLVEPHHWSGLSIGRDANGYFVATIDIDGEPTIKEYIVGYFATLKEARRALIDTITA